MTEPESNGASEGTREQLEVAQGLTVELVDAATRSEAIEAAFDYRGNVTLGIEGGSECAGFLFTRDARGADPWVDIMPIAGGRERIPYARLRSIAFTGRDTAAGKSWETWVKKYTEKKEREARGEQVESIDLFPDEDE